MPTRRRVVSESDAWDVRHLDQRRSARVGGSQKAKLRQGTLVLGGTMLEMPVVVTRLPSPEDYRVIIGSDFLRHSGSVRIDYDHKLILIGE